MQAKLSIVATPIGNLEDITLRALRTLREADIIACEDTRVTKKLLAHFDIHTSTTSFVTQGRSYNFSKILALFEEGKHVALATDAGTPGISDPGLELVSLIREKMPEVTIEAIPGPSALAAALSIAGLRAASFTFYGFLPTKKGRETLFKEIASNERASIFYESPHRMLKTLQSLQKVLPSTRRVGVYRELTKMFEESLVGSSEELLRLFETTPEKLHGEFVVIVEGERN